MGPVAGPGADDLRKLHDEMPPDVTAMLAKMAKDAGIDINELPDLVAGYDKNVGGGEKVNMKSTIFSRNPSFRGHFGMKSVYFDAGAGRGCGRGRSKPRSSSEDASEPQETYPKEGQAGR